MPCHLRSTQKSKYRVQSTALIGNILFARTKNFSLVRAYAYSSLDVLASEFTTFAWLGLRQFSPFKKYTLQYSSNETRPLCAFHCSEAYSEHLCSNAHHKKGKGFRGWMSNPVWLSNCFWICKVWKQFWQRPRLVAQFQQAPAWLSCNHIRFFRKVSIRLATIS